MPFHYWYTNIQTDRRVYITKTMWCFNKRTEIWRVANTSNSSFKISSYIASPSRFLVFSFIPSTNIHVMIFLLYFPFYCFQRCLYTEVVFASSTLSPLWTTVFRTLQIQKELCPSTPHTEEVRSELRSVSRQCPEYSCHPILETIYFLTLVLKNKPRRKVTPLKYTGN